MKFVFANQADRCKRRVARARGKVRHRTERGARGGTRNVERSKRRKPRHPGRVHHSGVVWQAKRHHVDPRRATFLLKRDTPRSSGYRDERMVAAPSTSSPRWSKSATKCPGSNRAERFVEPQIEQALAQRCQRRARALRDSGSSRCTVTPRSVKALRANRFTSSAMSEVENNS